MKTDLKRMVNINPVLTFVTLGVAMVMRKSPLNLKRRNLSTPREYSSYTMSVELDSLVVVKPPVTTKYSIKWAVKNFSYWIEQVPSKLHPNLCPKVYLKMDRLTNLTTGCKH